jgi:CRP-like cAMP-binding protein
VSGTLEIRNEGKKLDTAGAGQCLGEFAFLTGEPRNATVVAAEESEVLELGYATMQRVVASHPRVATVLDRMYHRRVLLSDLRRNPTPAGVSRSDLCEVSMDAFIGMSCRR